MILGNMNDADKRFAKYPEQICKALRYLRDNDFTKLEAGRYVIDGDVMYANLDRYETRIPESGQPEAHKRYVDVQFMVEGEEELGWCSLNPQLKEAVPYDEKKDIVFYQGLVPYSSIVLQKGQFAVLFPHDVHRPCGSLHDKPTQVTKVVVKIAVDSI